MTHFGRELWHQGFDFLGKLRIALKVIVVVVTFVLFHHDVPFGTHRLYVQAVHGFEVGGVKAWAQHGVANRLSVGVRGALHTADQQFYVVEIQRSGGGHGLLLRGGGHGACGGLQHGKRRHIGRAKRFEIDALSGGGVEQGQSTIGVPDEFKRGP